MAEEPNNLMTLADRLNNNRLIDAETALMEMLQEIRLGKIIAPKRLIIIGVNDGDRRYDLVTRYANISCSQILPALEVAKARVLKWMDE